ncbi:MAG: hypothetical protein P4L90_00955 [Rhodopila sp.]|nr:hypothetical protein [Rhodopila sp.]
MSRNILFTTMILAAGPALAQNPQPASPSNPTTPPEKIAPPEGNMSGRLSQHRGTIVPPDVDPAMTVSPPRNGRTMTPVIPPPGTPGGNRSVIPK